WATTLPAIQQRLAEMRPQHAGEFERNASKYSDEILAMHAYAEQAMGSIPQQNRILITSHDAFNYFGRAYGLQVEGIQGISTESEPGTNRITTLVNMLVNKKLPAVFIESSVPPKSVKSLIEGAADQGHAVTTGGELFSDAMGVDGTYEGTYLGMLDHNVTIVTRALGGQAPADGALGRLATVASTPAISNQPAETP
ncbi:MAG: zinc ABC transporter substrate-binding protein, partial [Planctomycetota bacterium]